MRELYNYYVELVNVHAGLMILMEEQLRLAAIDGNDEYHSELLTMYHLIAEQNQDNIKIKNRLKAVLTFFNKIKNLFKR